MTHLRRSLFVLPLQPCLRPLAPSSPRPRRNPCVPVPVRPRRPRCALAMPPAVELYPQLALVAAVAASHMSLPHHWLPYSLVGRAHGWALRSLLLLST